MTGARFGSRTVIARAGAHGRKAGWLTICDCGQERILCGQSVRRGGCVDCARRLRTQSLEERFSAEPNTGCWLWLGGIYPTSGYGHWGRVPAHRRMYETLVGPIRPGLEIDHKCRVRLCVNPAHLEPVTHKENMLRGNTFQRRNALKTHCYRGHAFTFENTRVRTVQGNTSRACRKCGALVARLRRLNRVEGAA